MALWKPRSRLAASRTVRGGNFCCFKPASLGALLRQPSEIPILIPMVCVSVDFRFLQGKLCSAYKPIHLTWRKEKVNYVNLHIPELREKLAQSIKHWVPWLRVQNTQELWHLHTPGSQLFFLERRFHFQKSCQPKRHLVRSEYVILFYNF